MSVRTCHTKPVEVELRPKQTSRLRLSADKAGSRRHLFFLFLMTSLSFFSQENDLKDLEGIELKTRIRLNYMSVKMPTEKVPFGLEPRMGLMGIRYQIPINNWLYAGLGFHGALFGDQGGLFTLGAELGVNQKLFNNIYFDANLHFAGGGGFRSLVNGGAMINPNIGLEYKKNGFAFGAQYSYINFTNGIIRSDALSFFVEIPSTVRKASYQDAQKQFVAQNLSEDNFWKKPAVRSVQQIRFDYYFPTGDSKKDNGDDLDITLHVLGFEYQKYLSQRGFVYAHADAIYKGLTAGYMQIFLGGGYNFLQTERFNLFSKFGLGAAGGRVAQEGGFMMYPSAGFDIKISKKFSFSGHGGYLRALDGSLEAYTTGFGIKYLNFSGGTQKSDGTNYSIFRTQGLRLAIENQSYWNVKRFGANTVDLQMIAMKVQYDLSNSFYIAGEASFAYEGNSGGYAHGLFALGYKTPQFFNDHFSLFFEGGVGAAGGGRVDTGEGIVVRPLAGLNYHVSKDFTFTASGGQLISPFGNVNSSNINIGLTYGLSSLEVKK